MASADIAFVRELIELQAPLRELSLAERRRHYERAESAFGGERARAGQTVDAGGCAAEWVLEQRASSQPVLVYVHGGGYCLGSSRSHRHLATAIGHASGTAVLSLDYRRAPEHSFPAAVDDARAATSWLIGRTPAPVVLAGDSAGGGLAIATMLALREHGERLPHACVCLSPWVDLTCESDAHTRLATRDPLLTTRELQSMADAYLQGADPYDPLASPRFARLVGLPPLLIQAGTEEILLDDARALARVAREEGVEATLQEWPDMVHAWQWYFLVLEEGRRAVAEIGAFVRRHAGADPASDGGPPPPPLGSLPSGTRGAGSPRVAPASPTQEAHLRIAPWTSGRGYLSWVYQLNGPLDVAALALAIDDVVRHYEILRVRFEHRAGGRLHQVATSFQTGALRLVDLGEMDKRSALNAAVSDARALYDSLSPLEDPRFRAILYTIDRKTAVLAMFVAEALVDSDSGALLSAAITRAYARRSGTAVPDDLPAVSDASYLDHALYRAPDAQAVRGARKHWLRQAHDAPPIPSWPGIEGNDAARATSVFVFEMDPAEWSSVTCCARTLRTTPYIFMLTCLQAALSRSLGATRFLAHSIVPTRERVAHGVIGNFHSLVRIDMRSDPGDTLRDALNRIALAVADAIEHRALPAPLAFPAPSERSARSAGRVTAADNPLAGIRFYMFASHGGPVFAGVRRRRFRLHGVPRAALSLSCVHGPAGRQDFVFSSTIASHGQLELLAADFRAAIEAAVGGGVLWRRDASVKSVPERLALVS